MPFSIGLCPSLSDLDVSSNPLIGLPESCLNLSDKLTRLTANWAFLRPEVRCSAAFRSVLPDPS